MLFVLALIALCASATFADSRCHRYRSGSTCQLDGLFCSGRYVSGKCNGARNRRCCVPGSGDRRCTSKGGTCKYTSESCSGSYKRGLCAGPSARRCCLPTSTGGGRGRVDYNGYTVSDADVRSKLQAIADLYGKRVWLTSGDRPHQSNTKSHHYHKRAADFWIDGESSGTAIWRRLKTSGILDRSYQIIYHGSNTCTGGRHMHIGRYLDNRNSCWVIEGTNSSNKCKYICQ